MAPPQLSERGRWRVVGTGSGQVQVVLPPMDCRDVELRPADVPSLGRQTDRFLTELGLSPEHRAQLQRDGVVQQHASTTGG